MEVLTYLTEPLHPVLGGVVHSVEILPPEEAGVLGVISGQVQEELRQQSGLPAESLGHDVDVGSVGSDGGVVSTSWVQRLVKMLDVLLLTINYLVPSTTGTMSLRSGSQNFSVT